MSKKMFRIVSLMVIVGLLLALSVSMVAAQSSLSTVTIKATDPTAKEPADKGQFTVYRTNSASLASLTVYYSISGTASNGVDYITLTGTVTIPAGAISAPITVTPRDDTLREAPETVIARITDPCYGPLGCIYNIGSPSSATVTIYDND